MIFLSNYKYVFLSPSLFRFRIIIAGAYSIVLCTWHLIDSEPMHQSTQKLHILHEFWTGLTQFVSLNRKSEQKQLVFRPESNTKLEFLHLRFAKTKRKTAKELNRVRASKRTHTLRPQTQNRRKENDCLELEIYWLSWSLARHSLFKLNNCIRSPAAAQQWKEISTGTQQIHVSAAATTRRTFSKIVNSQRNTYFFLFRVNVFVCVWVRGCSAQSSQCKFLKVRIETSLLQHRSGLFCCCGRTVIVASRS